GCITTTDGGDNWGACGSGLAVVFLFAFDPNTSAVIYATQGTNSGFLPGNQLFQSTDNGATFALIKTFPAAIQALATVKLDSNTLWVGLGDGTAQRTSNALSGASATWTPVTVTGSPGQAVSGVAIDPSNTAQVVVTYQGFTGIARAN